MRKTILKLILITGLVLSAFNFNSSNLYSSDQDYPDPTSTTQT